MGNLDLTQVSPNQNQKEQTINDADAAIESALTNSLVVDLSAGNASLSNLQFRRNMRFIGSGHSVPRVLTVPEIARAAFIVENTGTDELTVKRGDTEVVVYVGTATIFATDGTEHGLVALTATEDDIGQSFSMMLYLPGQPTDEQLLVRVVFNRTVVFPEHLVGSYARSLVAADAAAEISMQKNGSEVGTINFAIAADEGTFTLTGGVTFDAGDELELYAPTPDDATLATFSITLAGLKA